MPTSVYHTSQRETAHNLATAEAEKYKEFAPPSFVSLTKPVEGKSYPDALNPPLSARDNRLPPSHLAGAPAMRSGFTISDAALSRLLAPTNGHKSKASSSAVVDELAHVARTRLSTADVLLLRDKLTSILEQQSGAPAAAVTAVRVSRGFEAQLKAKKPISVKEVCRAFPMWPFPVQANWLKAVLRLGCLPFFADDEPASVPLPKPPPGDFSSGAGLHEFGDVPPDDFAGLEGTMLQPLGLALPALRSPGHAQQRDTPSKAMRAAETPPGAPPSSATFARPPPDAARASMAMHSPKKASVAGAVSPRLSIQNRPSQWTPSTPGAGHRSPGPRP